MGAAGLMPTSVFEFGGTSSTSVLDTDAIEPRRPSPTPVVVEIGTGVPLQMPPSRPMDAPRVQEREGDTLAFVSALTGAPSFAFGSGVGSFTSAASADAIAPSTPATHPSPRSGARRLVAFGFPFPSPLSSGRGRRAGTWNPATLGLANGVGPGTRLLDYSSDAEAHGGSSSGRR